MRASACAWANETANIAADGVPSLPNTYGNRMDTPPLPNLWPRLQLPRGNSASLTSPARTESAPAARRLPPSGTPTCDLNTHSSAA